MTDPGALQRAVTVECVVHTAAVVGDWPDRDDTRRVNVEGTRNLMLAARDAGVRRVVHYSSLAVYGNRHHRGTDESAPYRCGDTYTDAKIDSERAVIEFAERGELEAVSLRPGFVYGPGDRTLVPRNCSTRSPRAVSCYRRRLQADELRVCRRRCPATLLARTVRWLDDAPTTSPTAPPGAARLHHLHDSLPGCRAAARSRRRWPSPAATPSTFIGHLVD